jgi:hypothetical protein
MYQKNVDSDTELMDIYEQALNTDEDDKEEMEKLLAYFKVPLTPEEKEREKEIKELEKEAENQKELMEWLEDIKNLGDEHFEVDGIKLYMKGIKITVPEFLAREFAARRENEEDLSSLMNFWRLCALNPDPRCREDLYGFLMKNDISITPSGYFVTYRNVMVKQEGNKALHDFVVQKWLQVKKWKKAPSNYLVYENEDGIYSCYPSTKTPENSGDSIGTLEELYNSVTSGGDDSVIYTDAHTRTFTIKIGEVVTIPRNECDANPNQTCSRGLHLGNLNFMRKGSFGSEGLVCLCNPKDVVAVPRSYDGKMRTCSYLPIALAEYDEDGCIIPVDTATFEYEYAEHTQEELEDMLKTTRFESLKEHELESLKEHELVPKELDIASLRKITGDLDISLDEMNKSIQSRVVNV